MVSGGEGGGGGGGCAQRTGNLLRMGTVDGSSSSVSPVIQQTKAALELLLQVRWQVEVMGWGRVCVCVVVGGGGGGDTSSGNRLLERSLARVAGATAGEGTGWGWWREGK